MIRHFARASAATILGALLGSLVVAVLPAGAQHVETLPPLVAAAQPDAKEQPAQPKEDLFKLDLEKLMQVPVSPSAGPTAAAPPVSLQQLSSAGRQETTVGHSPAALFVITPEMISRSGATTVQETLRMVPGMDVARINSNSWAVSARGFNGSIANKMLVQVDGRPVYNSLFSGVFWDSQALFLQDLERVEVIRGPGATVWGANAVNGVVNIVSKSAKDTQGGLVYGGGGSWERGFGGFRYGGQLGDDAYYRIYGKWQDRGPGYNPIGIERDEMQDGRGGFRTDWMPSDMDTVTLQGDLFHTSAGQVAGPNPPDRSTSGGNAVLRWRRELAEKSDWTLQVYYDRFEQKSTDGAFAFGIDTYDVDYIQRLPLTPRQNLIYGLEYRRTDVDFLGRVVNGSGITTLKPHDSRNLFAAFVQDEIALVEDKLFFTAGSKFEHNDFTGFEYQPTARLLWAPDKQHSVWAGVSRAVRIPNILESDLIITSPTAVRGIFTRFEPSPGFISENVMAYELGYRAQTSEAFSWDLALFFNQYRNLAAIVPGMLTPPPAPRFSPFAFDNVMHGETHGLELAANYKVSELWRLYGAYTFLVMNLHADPSLAPAFQRVAESAEGQSPRNQFYLQSSWTLSRNLEFDLIGRYVDNLPGFTPPVPSYFSLDTRLAWRPRQRLELSVVGQNLLQASHLEFAGTPRIEIPRGVYGQVTYRW